MNHGGGWGIIDALLSKVGLKLSTHVHKSTALAMHTCRSRARVPHDALHRRWIIELTRHTHLHLQHGIDRVHTQASQPVNPTHALHPVHPVHSYLLGGEGESIRVGHRKWMLLLIALVVHQLAAWLHGTR